MDLQLNGKRALITGSSGGIGEGIAKVFAKEGTTVVIHGRNKTNAERVANEIKDNGGTAYVALGDLSTDDAASKVSSIAMSVTGGIDILVNNAADYKNRSWADSTPDEWAELYNLNVLSAVRMIRYIMPQMKKNGWGRIIQISSGEATQPFAFMPDYAATKAALNNLTVSLSKELANSGITSNTISPGIIVTSSLEKFYRETAAKRGWGSDWNVIEKHVIEEILYNPVGRLGTIDDVANLVVFVASPLASYINGANLRVDGGSVVTVN
ncbi:MAG: SDR family oxidoreductase [Thermoproteota archaeon]|nr:SDR family oxidoreductase [Thermoproteota archaeon]